MEPFLLRALAAGIGLAIVAAPLGCFVVWKIAWRILARPSPRPA